MRAARGDEERPLGRGSFNKLGTVDGHRCSNWLVAKVQVYSGTDFVLRKL